MEERENTLEEINDNCAFPFQELLVCIRLYHVLMQQICDLPMGELVMLLLICRCKNNREAISTTWLVKEMSLSRPAVSRMLHVLEKKGYIHLENDAEDHRCVKICPTSAGRELVEKEMETCADILKNAAGNLDMEEICAMVEMNRKFCGEIAKELKIRTGK